MEKLRLINKDLVSVYIVFNKYPINFLKECIIGVKNQTFNNLEYIFVVYGKNNDYTSIFNVISDCDIPFKIYKLEETENFIDAIKFAIDKCKGEFVFRSDADDLIMPNCIQNQYDYINQIDASIIIPNYLTIEENGEHVVHSGKEKSWVCHALTEKDKLEYVKFLEGQTFRDGTSIIETFKKYGFKIEYLDKVGFIHRIHKNSLTYDEKSVKLMDEKIRKES